MFHHTRRRLAEPGCRRTRSATTPPRRRSAGTTCFTGPAATTSAWGRRPRRTSRAGGGRTGPHLGEWEDAVAPASCRRSTSSCSRPGSGRRAGDAPAAAGAGVDLADFAARTGLDAQRALGRDRPARRLRVCSTVTAGRDPPDRTGLDVADAVAAEFLAEATATCLCEIAARPKEPDPQPRPSENARRSPHLLHSAFNLLRLRETLIAPTRPSIHATGRFRPRRRTRPGRDGPRRRVQVRRTPRFAGAGRNRKSDGP